MMPQNSIPIIPLAEAQFAEWESEQSESVRAWVSASGFKAAANTSLAIPGADGRPDRIVAGLGDGPQLYSLATLADKPGRHFSLQVGSPREEQMALGLLLSRYRFDRYRQQPAPANIDVDGFENADEIHAIVAAANAIRNMVNTPAEDMGPSDLSAIAQGLAERHGGEFTEIVGDQLLAQNFPAIHAVGRAATEIPRLLDIRWGDESKPRVTLVGKGVCFDSGGLDIKGASGMKLMKKDMGGGAHVLGLAGLIMAMNLPIRLRVLVPAVENAISGNAYRPGDVIPTRKGLFVEIGNTDAEGRMVLADALTYAGEEKPELIIDFATLTGAARIALGADLPPIYSNDDDLANQIVYCGREVEDPLWRMPLYEPYEDLIKSPIADITNSGSSSMAGSITAALFLQHFVPANIPWCHLDIYAWNPNDRPGRPVGGTAHAFRAVYSYLKGHYQ